MFEGFETSPTRGRKPIGIDTATTQAEPTKNGTLKKSLWGHSFIKSAPFLIKKWHQRLSRILPAIQPRPTPSGAQAWNETQIR